MANLADSEKYVTIEMRVSIDPKDGNIYMSSKDEDLMAQTAGGFRLQVPRTSRQDQALRSMVSALKERKKKEDQSNLTFGNVLQSFLRGGENITVGEIRDGEQNVENLLSRLSRSKIDENTRKDLQKFLVESDSTKIGYRYISRAISYLNVAIDVIQHTSQRDEKFIDQLNSLLVPAKLKERAESEIASHNVLRTQVSDVLQDEEALLRIDKSLLKKMKSRLLSLKVQDETQELIMRTTHQKMKNFSGWQTHAVPLGVLIDTRGDIDSEESLHLVTASWNMQRDPHLFVTASWNMQRDPHLYVRGPVASGKTTVLNNMKKYFISRGVPFTAISLANRESSLALLKKVTKATHSYGESIANAPTSVLIIDDYDDVFAEKFPQDFSDVEIEISEILRDLILSDFKGFNVVITGNIGPGFFGIKTELVLNQKNYTPPVVGDKIVQLFENRGQTYHQSNESLSPDLRIATLVQRYPNMRREDVIMYARQIALYQFDE